MIVLLFLLPLTDSIIPEDPAIGFFSQDLHAGFMIENRFQIKELTGGYLALWGRRWSFLVNGYGLGPLKIYRIRTHHSTHIIKNLAVGYGLSAHIYQFNDGNGHGTYGIDGGISYRDQLLSVILAGFDLNRPGLTNQDQITPRFSFAIAIGQNPSIQFQLHHEGFLSIYTGFSMPLSRVLSISSGYQNNPREISFAIALSLKPCLTYAGSLHEILGLSHRVGARL